MTPYIRQSSYFGKLGNHGAPRAIRTPGLLIRRLTVYAYFIFVFHVLSLNIRLKLIEGFCWLFRLRLKVCQKSARVKTILDRLYQICDGALQSQTSSKAHMGKRVEIKDRAVYRVQAYLTEKDYVDLEKLCAEKKCSVSDLVRDIIKEVLMRS